MTRVLAAVPMIATAPLAPWLVRRVYDGGALSIACALAGMTLVIVGARATRQQHGSQAQPAPGGAAFAVAVALLGAVVVIAGAVLSSRSLVVGGAFIVSGALLSKGQSALVVLPGSALVALAAVHPADIDALVGWPLRALLASGAAALLPATDGARVAVETVLVIEGKIADVEAACAGTRSMTALALCFACVVAARVLAAGAPRPRLRLRTVVAAASVALAVLLAASVLRVAVTVGLALVVDLPELAAIAHEPLGLFALLMAIAAAHGVLERCEPPTPLATEAHAAARDRFASARTHAVTRVLAGAIALVSALAVVASGVLVLASPKAPTAVVSAGFHESSSLDDAPDALPLTADERALFTQLGASAHKRALPGGGSVLVVRGPRRAHHAPERCLAAAGFAVHAAVTATIAGHAVRRLALERDGRSFVGLSFFVSPTRVVASALERALRDAALGEGPWVFVSILSPVALEQAEVVAALVSQARDPGTL